MKTPPFLMLATLLFWGWQSHMVMYGAAAGALLEISRVVKFRWELEDVDFNRIWSLCVLVTVALAGYIFSASEQGGGLAGMLHAGAAGLRKASDSSTAAITTTARWFPLISFPLIVAQAYNARASVPLTAISMVLRIRRRRGEHSLAGRYLDVSYPYFMVCLAASGIHPNQGSYGFLYGYFFGQAALILWALWTLRSRRFGAGVWTTGLAVIILIGLLGQMGVVGLERLAQNLDAEILNRLMRSRTDPTQSTTAIGQIGNMKLSPRIVIRLEPDKAGMAPNYLREATYRTYLERNQSWLAGSAGSDFSVMQPQPDNSTWLLLSNKPANSTVKIACYLNGRSDEGDPQGLLPLPSGCCRLLNLPYLDTVIAVQTNKLGGALATGLGLLIFNARYGPGATADSPPDFGTNQYNDLNIPTNEIPALNQIVSEMNVTNASDAEKRMAVQAFFARNFTYSTWQAPPRRNTNNVTPLTRFLLTSRSGHCEYFATATVLLLRKLGIPARYAVGYAVHEASGSGFVVRERDGHAWCLAWNRNTKTWDDFDTTPASWVAIEERNTSSFLDTLSDMRSWIAFQFAKLRSHQSNLRTYIIWTLSPVIVVLLYYIFFQRRSKTRSSVKKAATEAPVIWPGHDSAFYRLEKSLAARGLPRPPQETLSNWLERALAEPSLTSLRPPLHDLLKLHYRYRFDPAGLKEDEKMSLIRNTDAVLSKLSEQRPAN